MPGIVVIALGCLAAAAGYAAGRIVARRERRGESGPSDGAETHAEVPPPEVQVLPGPRGPREVIYALAQGAFEDYQRAAQPAHLLGAEGFERCVEAMRTGPFSDADLVGFYSGDVLILAVCAAEALARRAIGRDDRDRMLRTINDFHPYTRFFALRAITRATPATESAVATVLSALDASWQLPPLRAILTDYVLERVAAGDLPRAHALRPDLDDDHLALLAELLGPIAEPRIGEFLAAVADTRAARVDVAFLESVGTLGGVAPPDPLVEHRELVEKRALILAALTASPPRPVILVGEPGSGRRTLAAAVWLELRARGWQWFRAGHLDLVAGQSFVGQIEQRVRTLVAELGRSKRMVWFAPEFHGFLFAGRHSGSPVGLLDLVLPAITEGRFPLLAITEPAGLDLVARNKPAALAAFEVVRLSPMSEAASLDVAREWERRRPAPPPPMPETVLQEAAHLAQQYLGDTAPPGNLLDLLALLYRDRPAPAGPPATLDEVIACVARVTRLPVDVLDERQGLDLGALSTFFSSRVIGQPEAVETLVERVAMIKSGVTDPGRPLGVFLFAGPTGTGKTELAKALAEYLFGSPERLVRVDMSELQTPESLARLLGDGQRDLAGNALVDRIRREPFSVVLLDEFEKSHPQVWDLFLQVFDDGRLTDPRGSTADFRNTIIILTSNLGAALPVGPGLGFGGSARPAAESVEQAVARAFRREFFNRIDRILVFRPLSREVLRDILHKELRDVFRRRGLRNRDWVVVWDETAIDFLLDRGTTPDLGARPLKRAIERHVLSPLARTIVSHQVPRGDQFLFVRAAGDALEVEFVDPDAGPAAPPAAAPPEAGPVRLERLAFEPRGGADEVAALERHLDDLAARVDDDIWRERKRAALERQREPGFWDSPERFVVFGAIEQIDRIETGIESARRLFEKLRGTPGSGRTRFAAEHVGRLALRLFVLETAVADVEGARPLDAFLLLEAAGAADEQRAGSRAFLTRLTAMYRAWGARRGIKVETLLDETADARAPRVVLSASGLAAHSLLAAEAGLHVLEQPLREGRGYDRLPVRVRVAVQPEVPPDDGARGLLAQALAALEPIPAPAQIVRRYRDEPSALVRDTVRGWRSGRIDRVMAGDFDLLEGARDPGEPLPRDDEGGA